MLERQKDDIPSPRGVGGSRVQERRVAEGGERRVDVGPEAAGLTAARRHALGHLGVLGEQPQQLTAGVSAGADHRDFHAAAVEAGCTATRSNSASRTTPTRAGASRSALWAGRPSESRTYLRPTSLSVAGPLITVIGSRKSVLYSSAAPQQATGSGAHITCTAPTAISSGSCRMSCTPYSPRMPSPSSATITSGRPLGCVARRLRIALASGTVMPACVLAAPASLKVNATAAPASCIASASRIRETPVSFAAATRSPLRDSPRTSSVAAAVFPAFMHVPATYTTGTVHSRRSAGGMA